MLSAPIDSCTNNRGYNLARDDLVLADDHEIVRAGLKGVITQHENWVVCGEASNGVEAVSKVVELKPDIVIIDITMPVSGLEAAIKIRQLAPSTKILMLSIDDAVLMANLLSLAAPDGYLSKTTASDDLIGTIAALMNKQLHSRVTLGLGSKIRSSGPSLRFTNALFF